MANTERNKKSTSKVLPPVELLPTESAAPLQNGGGTAPPNGSGISNGIAKPPAFDINRFRSKTPDTIAAVGVMPSILPQMKIADANDFVRLHPDQENFWSPELCFVDVPVPGMRDNVSHLINEDVAMRNLDSRAIIRRRLALATKPHDRFFLCQVPSQNLDNDFNRSAVEGCEISTTRWVWLTSRKKEGVNGYKIKYAENEDAFPEPKWLIIPLWDLIVKCYGNGTYIIDNDDHPGLCRLIGRVISTTV
jgi:hypothetical protein